MQDRCQKIGTNLAEKEIVSQSLKRVLDYKKFSSEKPRILIIDTPYFLVKEVISACHKLNWPIYRLRLSDLEKGSNEFIKRLIWALINFKPDFLLTINHFGFDEEGKLTELLTEFKIPFASWFVDNPFFILKNYPKQISCYLFIFLWDKSYRKILQKNGFENIAILPLATDISRFYPEKFSLNPLASEKCQLSFVGNSMIYGIKKEMAFLASEYKAIKQAENLGKKIGIKKAKTGERVLINFENSFSLNEDQKIHFWALTTWKASQIYRIESLKAISKLGLRVYGDPGWKNFKIFSYYRPLNYYTELPYFFNVSEININITSIQMPEAINQRVFDVSACGSFIITDYQKQLEELFCLKEEIVCFRNKDELFELCKFYLKHPEKRQKKAIKARERVIKEHTYELRLKNMVKEMKRVFG